MSSPSPLGIAYYSRRVMMRYPFKRAIHENFYWSCPPSIGSSGPQCPYLDWLHLPSCHRRNLPRRHRGDRFQQTLHRIDWPPILRQICERYQLYYHDLNSSKYVGVLGYLVTNIKIMQEKQNATS